MTGRSHVVLVLTRKCIKTIIRNPALRLLILISSLSVFVVLYGIWLASSGSVLKYSSSQKYNNLDFDIICKPTISSESKPIVESKCYSNDHSYADDTKELSPTDILLNILYHGSMFNEHTNKNDFASLLSSILMNGFPLLGVNDYIKLSNFVNKNLGEEGRDQLLSYETTKEQFSNLLDIRNKEIRLTPRNCWTNLFSDYLQKASNYVIRDDDDDYNNSKIVNNQTSESKLKIKIFDNMKSATINYSEDKVLAIIEITSSTQQQDDIIAYEYEYKSKYEHYKNSIEICSNIMENVASNSDMIEDNGPHVTIRMEPAVVADTRNYEWSPRKNPLPRSQSGQLLYFISSFLTFQLEIQNFLASINLGGPIIPTDSFHDENNLINELELPKEFVSNLLKAKTPNDIYNSIMNTTQKYNDDSKSTISIPFYNRAYPTHRYSQKTFWHVYATMLPTVLIMLFSIPAAVIAGTFWREYSGSQLEVLCTLPGIKVHHSVISWCICCLIWTFFYFTVSFFFFVLVLKYDSAAIPSLTLLLCGIALAPLSILLGLVISRPDALVVAVPSFVFVSMLPGLLYPDLAFDTQRTMWFELAICLLPPSASALIIRQICSQEALNIHSTWTNPAPVSNTPLYYYDLMLLADCFIYSILAVYFITAQRVNTSQYKVESSHNLQSLTSLEVTTKLLYSCQQAVLKSFHAISKNVTVVISYFKGEQMYETLPIEHYGASRHVEIDQSSISINSPNTGTSMGSYCDDHISGEESYQSSNSTTDRENIIMDINGINKLYVTAGVGISVLHEFSAKLYKGSVTCLLGSNGAGKSTLLKILCGIDLAFDGKINIRQSGDTTKRIIGWCPQHDPLYDFLTVSEHLELFNSLLSRSENLEDILDRLDMGKHRNKLACELSGGMKRRLSLALAFIGEPQVLLLDEPSTGCDSWTRELVRKDIMSRKTTSAVLVSTHHIDDVEVLSDRVWFLNDRFLAFDGPVSQLYKEAQDNSSRSNADTSVSFVGMDFSSSDEYVNRQFMNKFPDNQQWILADESTRTWHIPLHRCGELRDFMAHLEARQNYSWSVSSPSIHKALTTMYTSKDVNSTSLESSFMRKALDDFESEPLYSTAIEHQNPIFSYLYVLGKQSKAILFVRFIDISTHFPQFLLTQILLPFLIVLAITFACRDITYPKVELSSRNMGVGEIIASMGNTTNSGYTFSGRDMLENSIGIDTFTWNGNENSDDMWQDLYKHYYRHEKDRWVSFVIDDHIDEWMKSTVIIDEASLNFSVDSAYEEIQNARNLLCNSTSKSSLFCGDNPNLKVSVMINRVFDPSSNYSIEEKKYLMVQAHQSLNSNLTMLSNVTTDHAAPVFLKEIAPVIYASRDFSSTSYSQKFEPPSYKLFSYPLPKTKFSSQIYIQRGYLGSIMIVLYILICTIKTVRFVTLFRRSGMKSQLHMSGLNITSYWFSNFLSDVSLNLVTMLASAIAIIVGGSPVSDFFLNYPPIPGVLFLSSVCTFSTAIVAASYAYSVQSSDQLSSQLLNLMSTVMGGVFLKLFLDRHKYEPFVSFSSLFLWISPCFNFSVCLFEMFSVHMDDLRRDADARELENKIETTVGLVFGYNKIMMIQTILYLLLTIMLDTYWVRVKAMFLSLKFWVVSFINEINFEKNLFSQLKTILTRSTAEQNLNSDMPSTTADIESKYDNPPSPCSIGSLSTASPRTPNKAGGEGVKQYLSYCDEIGFFPDIDPHIYKNARRRRRMENFLRGSKIGNHGSIQQKIHTPTPSAPSSPVSSINSDAIVEPVVHIEDLYVEYIHNVKLSKDETVSDTNSLALKGLNIDIHEGERIALIGMNGGGKSSLFKTLAMAELTPVSGKVSVNGMDLIGQSVAIGQQGILGYVPQVDSFFDFLTVDQTLSLFYEIKTSYMFDSKIEIEDLGIGILHTKYCRYPVHSLSGGNKKKLAVVAASMCNHNIILLDECTSGVDPVAAERIVTYLNDLNNTKCMLFSSHRVSECISLCNRVVILYEGRLFLEGPISCFGELSSRFYQVDITILNTANADHVFDKIVNICGGLKNIERIVPYTPTLIRMTYEKKIMAQSKLWNSLLQLQNNGLLTFSFLTMGMEETLSAIISSQK